MNSFGSVRVVLGGVKDHAISADKPSQASKYLSAPSRRPLSAHQRRSEAVLSRSCGETHRGSISFQAFSLAGENGNLQSKASKDALAYFEREALQDV